MIPLDKFFAGISPELIKIGMVKTGKFSSVQMMSYQKCPKFQIFDICNAHYQLIIVEVCPLCKLMLLGPKLIIKRPH